MNYIERTYSIGSSLVIMSKYTPVHVDIMTLEYCWFDQGWAWSSLDFSRMSKYIPLNVDITTVVYASSYATW